MAQQSDLNTLVQELIQLEKSSDFFNIGNELSTRFDSKLTEIVRKWTSQETLSDREKRFIDLYSKLQLSVVENIYFNSQPATTNDIFVELFRKLLFRKKSCDDLVSVVNFIRDRKFDTNEFKNEDEMIIYFIRMLDARSLAYRLCFTEILIHPTQLNHELIACLSHSDMKNYLYNMKSNTNINKDTYVTYRHRFFLGCCTLAVALYDDNKELLKYADHFKLICLLAKYARLILKTKHFEENQSFIYCLRGVLALLNNCVATSDWIHIINAALRNPDDESAQETNPFNIDLFSSIIVNLLRSPNIQKNAIENRIFTMTSLVDAALIFLDKWSNTLGDIKDEDNDENINADNSSVHETNQVLALIRGNNERVKNINTSQSIINYFDSKYDRIRLITVSILSNVMNNCDFQAFQNTKPTVAQDIVQLIFHFIDQALAREDKTYKGISFDLLLRYLLRFSIQDCIKNQTIKYIPKIVIYAERRHLCALKIIRRVSSSFELKQKLENITELNDFLNDKADNILGNDPRLKGILRDIRLNFRATERSESIVSIDDDSRQAFISYAHKNKAECDSFVEKLENANVFTKVWLDRTDMRGNIIDTITEEIKRSKVIFILLSQAYCESDTCRREWEFAVNAKKKFYPVIIEQTFERNKFDWVLFLMGNTLFYRVYEESALENLLKVLKNDKKTPAASEHDVQKIVRTYLETTQTPNATVPDVEPPVKAGKDWKKKLIIKWTTTDVTNWCTHNHFENWNTFLTYYDGKALLELNKALEANTPIQQFACGENITVLDVVRFKSVLQELVLRQAQLDRQTLHMKKKH